MGNGAWLVDGELVGSAERHGDLDYTPDARPVGPLRYRRGRILSIR